MLFIGPSQVPTSCTKLFYMDTLKDSINMSDIISRISVPWRQIFLFFCKKAVYFILTALCLVPRRVPTHLLVERMNKWYGNRLLLLGFNQTHHWSLVYKLRYIHSFIQKIYSWMSTLWEVEHKLRGIKCWTKRGTISVFSRNA